MMNRNTLTGASAFVAAAVMLAACGKPKAMTPEQTVQSFSQAVADRKPAAIWELLPPSYQADVNGLVVAAADKSDPDLHAKGSEVFSKLVAVLKTKKEFVLGLPMLAAIPNADAPKLAANYDSVVAILEAIHSSDLSNLDAMKKFDTAKFLKGPGTTIAEKAGALAEAFGGEEAAKEMAAFSNVQIKTTKQEAAAASLEVTRNGETTPLEMVKIEDRWIPAEMASDWSSTMTEAKAGIAKTSPAENKLQVLGMMGAITAVLDQLEKAQSQDEFNQLIMSSVGPFMGGGM